MHRIHFTPAASRSIQIGPRILERAVYAILRGTGAALLSPWKLWLGAPRYGARRWRSTFSWRRAVVQYTSAIGVWGLMRHPFYGDVNLSSGVCVLLLIYALASHRQGEMRLTASVLRHGESVRRWKTAAFAPAFGACADRARPGRLCLRARAR